jgi:hypothetical protein
MTWGFHSSCGIESSSRIEAVGTPTSAGIWVQTLPLPANVFDLQGNYLRSVSMPPVMGPRFRGFLADGSAVATVPYRVSYARSSTDSAAVV